MTKLLREYGEDILVVAGLTLVAVGAGYQWGLAIGLIVLGLTLLVVVRLGSH